MMLYIFITIAAIQESISRAKRRLRADHNCMHKNAGVKFCFKNQCSVQTSLDLITLSVR